MKDSPVPRSRDRLLTALLALGLAAAPVAFAAEPTTPTAPAASENTASPASATKSSSDEQTVVLSPFEVTTDKDRGYRAANSISGSRVNTAIKDIPVGIQVITSELINDIGATDLRSSLAYMSGIQTQTQNDLGNSIYGPGGVNNPEGVTSNINQVQMKIRGFVTNNTLRDGFYRGNFTDSVNIDRVEVVEGPNALLYGTGNFGGVVNYMTKQPSDKQQSTATFSYGSYDFMRATLDTTGPISRSAKLDYRLAAAWEDSETNVDFQKNSHFFIAPSVSWKPTPTTQVTAEVEYGRSKQNGYGFRALRAARGGAQTPINNDQLEAVSFYWPPGANKRSYNLSGPDTYNNQQASNLELKATQLILRETEFLPEINALVGYNHSKWNTQTRNVNAGMNGPILPGNPGYNLVQTITTSAADNGLGGSAPNNGNLQFGVYPDTVIQYSWTRGTGETIRDQERAEVTLRKALFEGKWYQMEEQVLGGFSALKNDITGNTWNTNGSLGFNYKSPTDLSPIVFGTQGDGTPDLAMYQSDKNNNQISWDSAYYLNSYFKVLKIGGVADRVILMNGVRRDRNDKWTTDTQITQDGVATTTTSRAAQVIQKSYQNGIMLKLTNSLSVYGLRSEGYQPNFDAVYHDAVTGAPVGSDTAKSKEFGIKFDFLDGRISGTISHYEVTKTAWAAAPWFAPAPLGHIHFDPNKPIVYNLVGGMNGTAFYNPFPGFTANGIADGQQADPAVQAAWKNAVDSGAVTLVSPISGSSANAGSLYINASTPQGAAYMDAVFNSTAGGWRGWPYDGSGDPNNFLDPGTNTATKDAAGFLNTGQGAAYQVVDQAKGWDVMLQLTPTDNLDIWLTASIDQSIMRLSAGQYPKYPYPEDRWAPWYYPDGGFGLQGSTLAEAYTDPTDTSTHMQNLYPGDDTPKTTFSALVKYSFGANSSLHGFSVGLGGNWESKKAVFSGITHGSGQAQKDDAGELIILYAPSNLTVNGFVRYDWKAAGYSQYVQFNVDNILNDTKLYGLIYKQPITAKLSYSIGF
jgi:outer membrane receptor protein involved in Fe transport